MNKEKAIEILLTAVEVAFSKGAYNLSEAAVIVDAKRALDKHNTASEVEVEPDVLEEEVK